MRVMGIDPGLTRCGLGVVDVDEIDRALRTLALPARITRPRDLERWGAGTPALRDAQVGYPQAD